MQQQPSSNTLWKVVLPVVIGIGVCIWLFHKDFSASTWSDISLTPRTVTALAAALLFVAGRDFGLTWRFHTIADGTLGWRQSLRVDLMCAFTSAITPSAVGGSALAIFYLNREGLEVGRATTLTLTTLLLDEMFFVVFCPIIALVVPMESLFAGTAAASSLMTGIQVVFWLIYAGIVAWAALLFTGIIWKPQLVESVLRRLFGLRFLRRWLPNVNRMTANMITTSGWVKHRPMRWWANVMGGTVISWFSRYLVVNALFWGFVPDASGLMVFARQFVVWVLLMISPTPGGSGVSEWLFTEYYGDLIGNAGIVVVIAMVWRLLTYYSYLAAGIALLPSYLNLNKLNSKP